MKKKCFRCCVYKPIQLFYKHKQMEDGHLGKCIECTKTDVKNRYYDPSKRSLIIEYERKRSQNEDRKKKQSEYQKRRRELHTEKELARRATIKLQKCPCEICGELKVEAHHPDYSKPLDVMWLCRKHHMIIENKITF